MSVSLQILNGSRYGETLQIDKTTSLGRSADISFDDPKMSKIHAIFDLDKSLGWIIRDQDSKNGLLVNSEKVTQHYLAEGDLIEFGTTQFRVASVSAFWKPALNQVILNALDSAKNAKLDVYAFRTIPTLHFVQGIQTGEKYVLEYGPRRAGGESEDIQLFEPHCPDMAFELSASGREVLFETKYPQIVRLNNQEHAKIVLKKGDQIHIHNTIIEINFLNT